MWGLATSPEQGNKLILMMAYGGLVRGWKSGSYYSDKWELRTVDARGWRGAGRDGIKVTKKWQKMPDLLDPLRP